MFRVAIPHYTPQSFREALINAYSHRDYSLLGRVRVLIEKDGMTISNPGGFIQGITYDNLLAAEPHGRNPVLADCLKRIGLAECSGRGIDRIYAGSLRYGKLPPDYSNSTSDYVRFYIPDSRPDKALIRLLMTEQERMQRDFTIYELIILNLLKTHRCMTTHELFAVTGIPFYKIWSTLETLVEIGMIETVGQSKNRRYILGAKLYREQKNELGYVGQTDVDMIRYNELIMKLAKKKGVVTRADVVALLHVSPTQAYRLLNRLKKNNLLRLEGKGKYSHYKPV